MLPNHRRKVLLLEERRMPTQSSTVVPARRGVPRPEGKAIRDDTGSYHPLRMTFFWAYQGWTRDRLRFQANIEFLKRYHYDSVRILGQVDWADWPINPDDPNYRTYLGETIDYLYSQGLRTGMTVQGSWCNDSVALANKVCDVILPRLEKVETIEMANEYDVAAHVDIATMQAMANVFKTRGCGHILALSSPGDTNGLVHSSHASQLKGFTVHTDRRNLEHGWNWVEQGYGFKDLPFVNLDDEPPGPAASAGGDCQNVLQLTMMRAVAVMCQAAEYTLHVASMVKGQPDSRNPPRYANLWEVPNIDQILRCVRQIDPLLPQGVENWRVCIESFRESPFVADAYWESGADHGVFKPYAAINADQWVQMPMGILHYVDMIAKYNLKNVRVYNPLTLQLVQEIPSVPQGQMVRLQGAPDTMAAYIIHGNF